MASSTRPAATKPAARRAVKRPATAARHDYLDHCVELLTPLGAVRTLRMFGGHGVYVDELFIAIVTGDCLYLKADDETRERFRADGCHEFSYEMQGQRKSLGYWTVPEDAMDAPPAMAPWARLAMAAALRARARKKTSAREPRKSTAPAAVAREPAAKKSVSKTAKSVAKKAAKKSPASPKTS